MDGARGARGIRLFCEAFGCSQYPACFRLEIAPNGDAAVVAAGPDVIR